MTRAEQIAWLDARRKEALAYGILAKWWNNGYLVLSASEDHGPQEQEKTSEREARGSGPEGRPQEGSDQSA